MNTETKLHKLQKLLIEKLMFTPELTFNKLLIKEVDSEHMNYHLKRLVEFRFVEKKGRNYFLTDKGKDYANLLDDEMKIIEKQPKTSVIINAVRKNSKGKIEFLLYRRLKQPYFGKVGRVGGKVKYGENFKEAAARELKEETGLEAGELVLEEIYRKIRHREDGSCIQDVIFYIFFTNSVKGKLEKKNKFQENFWATKKDVYNNPDIDPFDDIVLNERFKAKKLIFVEYQKLAEGY